MSESWPDRPEAGRAAGPRLAFGRLEHTIHIRYNVRMPVTLLRTRLFIPQNASLGFAQSAERQERG